ncbi:MAG: ATP-binding cassette domain-containing protein [Cardiobacteriaceae bacterium]|nr:ATP-binding cassette domain-containing protein [Cardiobacteriaceae bacterium]
MREALIALDNIAYHDQKRRILHDITLRIMPGEILTIVGPNGAGKSTLLALITGKLRPSSGHIRRKNGLNMAYVPQKFHPPADLPITAARFLKDIPNALQSPWLDKLGIAAKLDTRLQNYSGGETQRLLLARAILKNPDLIILDEPAAGIDPGALSNFYAIIRDAQQALGCAILMVSHDLHLVMAQSHSVLCLNRHICCHGSPAAIRSHPEFTRLFPEADDNIALYVHHHDHQHL